MNHEKRRVLMCKPEFYGVHYEINPWMNKSIGVDPRNAGRQWLDLKLVLENFLNFHVSLVPQIEGLPDMVFTANAGLAVGNRVALSGFKLPERALEAEFFNYWFKSRGFQTFVPPAGLAFEGEGDAFCVNGKIYAGGRIRTDPRSHGWLENILEMETVSLELVSADFYHLDTCFCPLGESAFYYPRAFAPSSLRTLRSHFPDALEISREDARRFACNAVVNGRKIVMNRGAHETTAELMKRGYEVLALNFDEFLKAGGSAKCLAMHLDRTPLELGKRPSLRACG